MASVVEHGADVALEPAVAQLEAAWNAPPAQLNDAAMLHTGDAEASPGIPELPTDVIVSILSHTGDNSCASLSKDVTMQQWPLHSQAHWLTQRYEPLKALQKAAKAGQESLCNLLLHAPSASTLTPEQIGDAFVSACAGGDLRVVQLFSDPSLPQPTDTDRSLALCVAAQEGHLDVVNHLLTHPTQPVPGDTRGNLALTAAASHGHTEVCKQLLSAPTRPAKANSNNSSALFYATYAGHTATCKLLMQYRSSPAWPQERGSRALVSAAERGHKETVELLLSLAQFPSHDLKSALQAANKFDRTDVIQLLEARLHPQTA